MPNNCHTAYGDWLVTSGSCHQHKREGTWHQSDVCPWQSLTLLLGIFVGPATFCGQLFGICLLFLNYHDCLLAALWQRHTSLFLLQAHAAESTVALAALSGSRGGGQ